VEQLRHASPVLQEMIQNGRLEIVGAEYSLKTGLVDFLPD
jgi:carbonic anhydrase